MFLVTGAHASAAGIETLLSSRDALQVLCAAVQQTVRTRFEMSRDLLLLLLLCVQVPDQVQSLCVLLNA